MARPNLLSLPTETLSTIISFTDKSTALAFVRVSRQTSSVNIDHLLWRHLRLSVPDHPQSGEYSHSHRGLAEAKAAEGVISQNLVSRAKAAEGVISQNLVSRVRTILHQERKVARRSGLVRSIEMVPRPSALGGILSLLSAASETLETLTIYAPQPHHLDSYWRPEAKDTLDIRLFNSGTTFPVLRSLTLGEGATRFPGFAPYLCGLAPLLDTLIIHVVEQPNSVLGGYWPTYPVLQTHPNILNLHISRRADYDDDHFAVVSCKMYLDRLPNLRRLSIGYLVNPLPFPDRLSTAEDERLGALMRSLAVLGHLEHLEALKWCSVDPAEICAYAPDGGEAFRGLRRLVLGPVSWRSMFDGITAFTNIETIFFCGLRRAGPANPIVTTDPTAHIASAMDSELAWFIRNHPHLRLLHVLDLTSLEPGLAVFDQIDQIDAASTPNGRISSYRRGDEEILYAHLLVALPATFATYTDYNGEVVPLEILEEMRVVDGKSQDEWRSRGVEVGEKAWEVLMAWKMGSAA